MTDDLTPTVDDRRRDLRADLETALGRGTDPWPALAAAVRRALAAEANNLEWLRLARAVFDATTDEAEKQAVHDLYEHAKGRGWADIPPPVAQLVVRRAELAEAENIRLRNLCRELEKARDERDVYLRDLEQIGRLIGCDHYHDGLSRCVRDCLQEVDSISSRRWQAAVGHSLETAERLARSEDPKP